MLQTLTYYSLTNTCVLIPDSSTSKKQILFDTSASFENSTSRINLTSASIVVGTLPYDQTNFFINTGSNEFASSSITTGIQYTTSLIGVNSDPSFYFKISSSLGTEVNIGLNTSFNSGFLSTTSSAHIVSLYSGTNKNNSLSIYNSSGSLISSSSWIGTGSSGITFYPTSSSYYYISASVYGYACCFPTFTLVESNKLSDWMEFSFITGSCGTCTAIGVEKSLNGFTWTLLTTGSCTSSSIHSDPGTIQPSDPTYYRLIMYCSGGYVSDPSNILIFNR